MEEDSISEMLRQIVEQVSRAPTASETREFANGLIRAAAERADRFRTAVRPIWKANAQGRPTHVGSCVLATISDRPFILTAAHVVDHGRGTTLYIGLDQLRALPATFDQTVPPGGDRLCDVVDFAFMPFPDGLIANLGDATFVPEEAIGARGPVEGQMYTCLGYPNAKNRDPYRGATAVRGKLRSYTSVGRPVSCLPQRAVAGVHVLVDRDPHSARKPDGVRIKAARAYGYSGGAIFAVGATGSAIGLFLPVEARLVAIYTEAHDTERVIMGTRLDYAIEQAKRLGRL